MNFFSRHRPQYAPPPGPPPPARSPQGQYAPPPGPPLGRTPAYAPPSGPPPSRTVVPPQWAPAPERSHTYGLYNEASDQDYTSGEAFCNAHPLEPPKLLASADVDRIQERGCAAWGLVRPNHKHFVGTVSSDNKSNLAGSSRIITEEACKDSCVLGDLPLIGGLYERRGKMGVYYEVRVNRMDGVIAVGTACKPYPSFRLPGWNRQSAALHLDDMRKFYEDPDGGRDYATDHQVHPGCIVGCGYEFATGVIFFTFNGERLPEAFRGLYFPHGQYDVYAAIGVDGSNDLEVNFGTSTFAWKEGNEWAWRVEGHVGQAIGAPSSGPAGSSRSAYPDEDLPSYSATA